MIYAEKKCRNAVTLSTLKLVEFLSVKSYSLRFKIHSNKY